MRLDDGPLREYRNRLSAPVNWSAVMTVNRLPSGVTLTIWLLALLKARRPPRRERSVRFVLPALHSAADAPNAMAAIAAAVSTGEISPAEAAELARLVEA